MQQTIRQLIEQEEYRQAKNLLESALHNDEYNPDLLNLYGEILRKLADYRAAVEVYSRLINLQPGETDYYEYRGICYYQLQQSGLAIADLSKAIELEPGNAYRYASRAYIKELTKDLAGAFVDYTKALELDPHDEVALNNRGLIEEKLARQHLAQNEFADGSQLLQRSQSAGAPQSKQPGDRPNKRLSWRDFFYVLKQLIVSGRERQAFVNYLRQLLKH